MVNYLLLIGKELEKVKNIPNVWRLYQYSPYLEIDRSISESLLIDDETFQDTIEKLKDEFKKLTISSRSISETNGYCILMDSVGNLFRYDGDYHFIDTNIFEYRESDLEKAFDLEKNRRQKEWQQ